MVIQLDSIKKESEEVFYTKKDLFSVSQEDIDFLIDLAKETERKRVRLCCHSKQEDVVHEMIIVHPKNAYVRPHKHLGKVESMSILEGEADVILFHNNGKIMKSYHKELWVDTPKRMEFINITGDVETTVYKNNDYFCPVYCESSHKHIGHFSNFDCGMSVSCYHFNHPEFIAGLTIDESEKEILANGYYDNNIFVALFKKISGSK